MPCPSADLPAPLIVGLAGTRLTRAERDFLEAVRPLGIIVFARNVGEAATLDTLVEEARGAAGCALALVDQEGGRVARLKPPLAHQHPPAAAIGALFRHDAEQGRRAAWLTGALIGRECLRFGLNVPCLPVADVARKGMTEAIGDRTYGDDPAAVTALASAVAEGVLAAGSLPVMKHAPGHGRARHDTHFRLARVDADRAELEADAAPFERLSHIVPIAMTSHILYQALDPGKPATLSAGVIDFVRALIGDTALLLTDDISMKALPGSVADSAKGALAAGCDVVLHCNGDMAEMEAAAAAIPKMGEATAARLANVQALARQAEQHAAAFTLDEEAIAAERDGLLARAPA